MAVLQQKTVFKCFLVLDSFALVSSVVAVVLLVFGKASRSDGSWKSFVMALQCIWASLVSMILASYTFLSAVTTTRVVSTVVYYVISAAFVVLFAGVAILISPPVSMHTMLRFLWQCGLKGRHGVVRRRIKQQYQVIGAFVPNLFLYTVTNNLAFVGLAMITIYAARDANHSV
ncbi:hypothetical protein ACQ4PT_045905 [Festuca glaucescens]